MDPKKYKKIVSKINKHWEEFVEKNPDFKIPDAFFCIHEGKHYITMNDADSIYYFYSYRGKIFVAARSSCKIIEKDGIDFYYIENYEDLQVVSCRYGINDKREDFIENKIKKYLTQEV